MKPADQDYTMSDEQALTLITFAGLVDPRASRLSADKALAWREVLWDVDYDEAMPAVIEHLRTSTDVPLPAHVLAIVKRNRAKAAELQHHRALEAEGREAEGRGVPMPESLRRSIDESRAETERRREVERAAAVPLPARLLPEPERQAKMDEARRELDARRAAEAARAREEAALALTPPDPPG